MKPLHGRSELVQNYAANQCRVEGAFSRVGFREGFPPYSPKGLERLSRQQFGIRPGSLGIVSFMW